MERKFEGEFRPWGKFKTLAKNEKCTVKILTVRAGEKLSIQYHNNREEYWKIIGGRGSIKCIPLGTLDSVHLWWYQVNVGDEIYIPKKFIHSAEADKYTELKILEVSYGNFDEKDIVRLYDRYNR